jgi:hypothetical protein
MTTETCPNCGRDEIVDGIVQPSDPDAPAVDVAGNTVKSGARVRVCDLCGAIVGVKRTSSPTRKPPRTKRATRTTAKRSTAKRTTTKGGH